MLEWDKYNMCKEFNCLPFPGGWYDQPEIQKEIFKIIFNAYQEKINNENRGNKMKAVLRSGKSGRK